LHPSAGFLTVEARPAVPFEAFVRCGKGETRRMEASFPSPDGKAAFAVLELDPEAAGCALHVQVQDAATPSMDLEWPLSFAWADGESSSLSLPPWFDLFVPENASFESGAIWVRAVSPESLAPLAEGRTMLSAVEILPLGTPFLRDPRLRGFLPTSLTPLPEQAGWYRKNFQNDGWSYLGNDRGEDAFERSLFVPYGAVYALMVDSAPPRLDPLLPAPAQPTPSDSALWKIRASDEESGVNYESVRFVLDGSAYQGDYDPDRGEAFLDLTYHELQPVPGEHRLRVEVADYAGNSSAAEFTFAVFENKPTR
jgi:hypothetical protein